MARKILLPKARAWSEIFDVTEAIPDDVILAGIPATGVRGDRHERVTFSAVLRVSHPTTTQWLKIAVKPIVLDVVFESLVVHDDHVSFEAIVTESGYVNIYANHSKILGVRFVASVELSSAPEVVALPLAA